MNINWSLGTEGYTLPIFLRDNEEYESGYRETQESFPSIIHDEDKYYMICQNLFSTGPKLKFIKSDSFNGSKYGYVYYMGPSGLGYYIDPLVMRHVYYK